MTTWDIIGLFGATLATVCILGVAIIAFVYVSGTFIERFIDRTGR